MTVVKEATVKQLREEATGKGIEFDPKATKAKLLELIVAHDTETETADLRARAEEAGIEVPDGATKADLSKLLDPEDPHPLVGKERVVARSERRPITHITDRGDWQDPFADGDYLVFYAETVSERTGARRDGDEAVLGGD